MANKVAKTDKPKPTKIDPESELYRRRMIETALSFCPEIEPCKECGSPTVDGYCCTYCGYAGG